MESGQVLEPTVSLKGLLEDCRTDPITYFEKYPVREIRTECLRLMREIAFFRHHADWAERTIHLLRQMGDNSVAQDLLSVYVFQAKDDENIVRAIGFLIREEYLISNLFTNDKSKLLCGRMLGGSDPAIRLYSKIPGLKEFLSELLTRITGPGKGKKFQYHESDWFETERALKIIMSAGDWKTFLEDTVWLLELHQGGMIHPDDNSPQYLAALHRVMIKETVKVLRQAKRDKEEEE